MTISMSLADTQPTTHSLTLVQQSSYFQIASTVILLHDYTLNVYDEYELVWRAPWSTGKVLFLLNRYPPFVDAGMGVYRSVAPSTTVETCTSIYDVSGWMIIVGIIISELIMVTRVWALWRFSRIVGACLLIMAIIGVGMASISYLKFTNEITFIDTNVIAPHLNGCFPTPRTNIVFLAFVGLMVWEIVVMILLLLKGAQHFRHVSNGFLRRVYQDGIMYYVVMVLISCMNIVILLTRPRESANLLTPIQRALHSIISSHMLLQLRQNAQKRQHFPNDCSPIDIDPGTLVFASRPGRDIATWFGDDRGLGM